MESVNVIIALLSILAAPWLLGSIRTVRNSPAGRRKPVSVIITSKDNAKTLTRSLQSIVPAIGRESEILVVDMGSTDSTIAVAESFGCHVVEARKPPDGDMRNHARYTGAKKADKPLLFFIDGDCLPSRGFVEKALRYHRSNTCLSVTPFEARKDKLAGGLMAMHRLLKVMSMNVFALKKIHKEGLFPECMLIERQDYFNVCTHDMVPLNADTGFFLSQSYKSAQIGLRGALGADDFVRDAPEAPERIIPYSIESAIGVSLYVYGSFCIALNLAISIFTDNNAVIVWAWLYILYGATTITYEKKLADINVIWGMLVPLQAACSMVKTIKDAWGYLSETLAGNRAIGKNPPNLLAGGTGAKSKFSSELDKPADNVDGGS